MKAKPKCWHSGGAVCVGEQQIFAGGLNYMRGADFDGFDVIIPLEPRLHLNMGQKVTVLACPWRDFGPPPPRFEQFLQEEVAPLLKAGKRVLVYCLGSHGRTGTFLAALIALLEPETKDPIAAVRARHCKKAVETLEQARAIFALKGQPLPEKYESEFVPVQVAVWITKT